MDTQLIELIYNQKDICEDLVDRGSGSALKLIDKKYSDISAFEGKKYEYLRDFLSSLNLTLYHYVLFITNPFPGKSYYTAYKVPDVKITREVFLNESEKILDSYDEFIRPPDCQNKHIQEACKFIKDHLDEELTLERVSSCIFVTRCYLCHLFRSCLKMKFSEYVTRERNLRAKALLCDNELSIDTIAERCGFSSSSYFSTVFKKATGLSPREYRRKMTA